MEEKRNSKRSDLDTMVHLELISRSEKKELDAEIINVSRNGVGFSTKEQLLIGEIYKTKMTLWTKQTIDVILRIVRAEELGEGYEYGSTFVGMENSDMMRIFVYQMFNEEE